MESPNIHQRDPKYPRQHSHQQYGHPGSQSNVSPHRQAPTVRIRAEGTPNRGNYSHASPPKKYPVQRDNYGFSPSQYQDYPQYQNSPRYLRSPSESLHQPVVAVSPRRVRVNEGTSPNISNLGNYSPRTTTTQPQYVTREIVHPPPSNFLSFLILIFMTSNLKI